MKSISLILLSLMLASPALAKRGRGEGKHGQMFKQLDLSSEQKTELKEIRESRKEKMKALKTTKKESGKTFREAMKADASNSSLKSLHNKMLTAGKQLKKYRFETMLKTRAVLTDTQRKKFGELKKEGRGKRRHHRDED